MKPLPHPLLLLLACWLLAGSGLAQTARDRVVEVNAVAQESPPTIILSWNPTPYSVLSQKILRRVKGAPGWSPLATLSPAGMAYTDSSVTAGTAYEYAVVRNFNGGPGAAYGYVLAGIRVPLEAERGRVILLVDDTVAAPLATELATFIRDLTGDGWTVLRHDVSRTAPVPQVKALIQSLHAADPGKTRALILFGHVPVPYSGGIAIDGHPDHAGAWPTDAYYGDIDGIWTDATVNISSSSIPARTRNVPGDGRFDQTILPSDVELQVGRIDLANLPAFNNVGEVELLRRYLARNHEYRHRLGSYATIPQRGLIDDHWGFFGGEAFAVGAWRSMTAGAGVGNITEGDWFGTLGTQVYQWAFGGGGGSYTSAAGVGTTAQFASSSSLAVFTFLFGSYFGDWDYPDGFLRAPLANNALSGVNHTVSLGLLSCWSGRPHWHFHHMALGETAGYSTRAAQNNTNAFGGGYDANVGERFNHLALMGDPTLRLYPVSPPPAFTPTPQPASVLLTWSAPADGPIAGYALSRASSASGPFEPLRSALVTGTSFVDRTVEDASPRFYQIRAVKLQTSPTGTFLNPSQGVFSSPVNPGAPAGPEIHLTGHGRAIANGDPEASPENGTHFGEVETTASAVHTFTIRNPGTASLTLGTPALGGSHPGDFAITSFPPASLPPGGSTTFSVRFAPLALGARTAQVTLLSDDADESSSTFAVAGTGLPPHAQIAVYPPSIQRTILPGGTAGEVLEIGNPGPGTLSHTVVSSLTRYSARDSDSFGGPSYAWTEIAGTGAALTALNGLDDAISAPVNLGLTFPFYGASYTTARICTNGFLSFTDTNASGQCGPLPNLNGAASMVAALWADLILDAASRIYTQTIGDRFIVQYENLALYGDATVRVTFQIVLRQTGEIFLVYKALTNLGTIYTIGLQNTARDDALLVAYNAAYARSAFAIRLRPPQIESWLGVAGAGGNVSPGGQLNAGVSLDAGSLPAGDYFAELLITSNARNAPQLVVPVKLTVGPTPVENWRQLHFGTTTATGDAADSADPDRDGRQNALEYALGSDPNLPSVAGTPSATLTPGGRLQIQFSRDTSRTDLSYFVEASSAVGSGWTVIARSIHGAPIRALTSPAASETGAGPVKTVTVEDIVSAGSTAARFLRLRTTRD